MTEKHIPEVTFSDNKVVLQTIEIPLIVNKEKTVIKMQKIPSGKRRDLLKKHINTKIVGQQMTGEVINPLDIQIALLKEAIIEAPFDITIEVLESLPDNVTDYLFQEYENWTKKKLKSED